MKESLNKATLTTDTSQGWGLLEERGPNGELLARHVHGPSVDDLVLSELNGVVYYYHQDHLNSTIAVTDENGHVVEQYRYDVYGQPYFFGADSTPRAESALGLRFLFTGREWLSSLGLYDYRHRIYSPSLGRFVQLDPLGFAGGFNLYLLSANVLPRSHDPFGLCQTWSFTLLGTHVALVLGALVDVSLVGDTRGALGLKFTVGYGVGIDVPMTVVTRTPLSSTLDALISTCFPNLSINRVPGRITDLKGTSLEAHIGVGLGGTFQMSETIANKWSGLEIGNVGGGVYRTHSAVLTLVEPVPPPKRESRAPQLSELVTGISQNTPPEGVSGAYLTSLR